MAFRIDELLKIVRLKWRVVPINPIFDCQHWWSENRWKKTRINKKFKCSNKSIHELNDKIEWKQHTDRRTEFNVSVHSVACAQTQSTLQYRCLDRVRVLLCFCHTFRSTFSNEHPRTCSKLFERLAAAAAAVARTWFKVNLNFYGSGIYIYMYASNLRLWFGHFYQWVSQQ